MSKTRTKQQNGGKGGFRETFASARKAGKKTFAYRGKKYTTQTAEEEAKTMPSKKLYNKWGQGTGTKKEAKGYKAYQQSQGSYAYPGKSSKSEKEIERSRRNELLKRHGDAKGTYGKKIKDTAEPMKEIGYHLKKKKNN
tara:strand:- start:79 stop:495 length:417 start_codon:yes stop_codon:yes gene_type:complete